MCPSIIDRPEKRQHRRYNLHFQALLKKKGTSVEFSGETTDISEMGVHLTTNCPLYVGDELDLTIYFQQPTNKLSMTVPGKVARIDGNGGGLTSPQIDSKILLHLELISDVYQDNTKQLIEEFVKITDPHQNY